MSLCMKSSPLALAEAITSSGLKRGFVVCKNGALSVSHSSLNPLKEFLEADKVDFKDHEGMFFEVGAQSKALMGAFIWNTVRGQACGGIRMRGYADVEDYVRDGMRLAIGMGRKSSLAGLWAGGGKGVILQPEGEQYKDKAFRQTLFNEYGSFVTSLRGAYVAAEDVGLNVEDLDIVFQKTRYTTCISPALGGSGNPSVPTAAGVAAAMEGAFVQSGAAADAGSPLAGASVAIQGTGNVGRPLIKFLLEKGVSRVIGADFNEQSLDAARDAFGSDGDRVQLRQSSDRDDCSILFEDVDCVAPCAFGGVLNDTTIPQIKAKIVCGAANNQLADPSVHDELLAKQGVVYVPDFLANRMGIVNCANEAYGRVGANDELKDPAITRHFDKSWESSVYNVTVDVLDRAKAAGITPNKAAEALADELCTHPHPIWGHRTQDIIDALLEDEWHLQ